MINRILFSVILIYLCFALSGCGTLFAPSIDDLKFVSAAFINLKNHPEILTTRADKTKIELLQINFTSGNDLLSIARDHEFFLSYSIFFCSDGPEKNTSPLDPFSPIYFFNTELSDYVINDTNLNLVSQNGLYEYRIFIEAARNARINVIQQNVPAYNLHSLSENLCVKLHGGNMIGTYFDSNILTIPKEEILYGINRD